MEGQDPAQAAGQATPPEKSSDDDRRKGVDEDRTPEGPPGYAMSTGARLVMRRTVKQLFTYHRPDAGGNQERRYRLIREMAMELAETIYLNTPRCADQVAAIRKLREAVMTANASIALDGAV